MPADHGPKADAPDGAAGERRRFPRREEIIGAIDVRRTGRHEVLQPKYALHCTGPPRSTMVSMPDPVQLEYSTGGRMSLWARRLAVALTFFPLLMVASVYGGWLIAWAALGHRPVQGFDDPQYAGWRVYLAVMPAEILTAVAWLVCVAFYHSLTPGNPTGRKLAVLAAAVLPWAAAFVLLNADPGGVMKWAGVTPP